jgi:hypothetical protein
MGSSEKFCLKWNDFQTNISASFQDLRKDQDFSDVTLTCDGDTRIETHRVILAGSSKFFSRILKQQQHPHPMLYMRGMTAGQLSAVVDFIYHGEANIYQEDLDGFLVMAEELQLKGLNGAETDNKDHMRPVLSECKSAKSRNREPNISQQTQKQDNMWHDLNPINELGNVITEETSMVPADAYEAKTQTNYAELDTTLDSMMEKNSDRIWSCNICGKTNTDKAQLRRHIEGKHIDGVSHPCNQCGKSFRSRESLRIHIINLHRQ